MTELVKLINYNCWANKRIMQQLMQLPKSLLTEAFGGSFPSIKLTILHLLNSDWIWLNRWNGIAYIEPPAEWQEEGLQFINQTWIRIQKAIQKVGGQLAQNPNQLIRFSTKKGDQFGVSFSDTVIHAFNHGTYYRGQIINMIRMAGEKPVDTDYFLYCSLQKE